MAFQIAQVDIPGIWQAGANLEAANQRSKLLDFQAQAAAEKLGVEKQQRARLAAYIDTLPADQKLKFGAFPQEFGAAMAKAAFPDPKDRFLAVPDVGLADLNAPGGPRVVIPSNAGLSLEGGGPVGGPVGGPTPQNPAQPGGTAELPPLPDQLRPLVTEHAQRNGLDPDFIGRMVMKESTGRADAVSPKGARGLMQAMEETARQPGLGVTPMKDWSETEQIRFGTDYYAALLRRYGGDHRQALAAWNWGLGNFEKWKAAGADPNQLPAETQDFVATLMPGQPQARAPNAPLAITPGGQNAVANAALGGGVAPPNGQVTPPGATSPSGQGATPGAVPVPPPATVPPDAVAAPPDGQGLRRVLQKGTPYTQGLKSGYQWAVDGNRNWFAVPIRGAPEGAPLGDSAEGKALQVLVDQGMLTLPQAAAWMAGKPVSGPNGQLDFFMPGRGLTTLRQGQMSAQEKEDIKESDNSIAALQTALDGLREAATLNDKSFQGAGAELKTWLDRNLLPGDWGGEDTTVFNTLIRTQALQLLKPTFGGNPTEGERKAAEQLLASLDKSIEERRRVLDLGIKAAEGRLAREKARAEALRAGTYYREGVQEPKKEPATTDPGEFGKMDKPALLAVDPSTLNAEQKAAYLAALRAKK
jgi:Transglycosylase SLT domain